MSSIFGGGTNTVVQQPSPLSPEETKFIDIQTRLAKEQLGNVRDLHPFQMALLKDVLGEIGQDRNYDKILNKLITPRERANIESRDFDLAKQFGPRLDTLQQMQMADLQAGSPEYADQAARIREATSGFGAEDQAQMDRIRGLTDSIGMLTPEQESRIRAAADASIASGSYDIDQQTKEGLGLIEDEIANSRGLRMSDVPILREATLLARNAEDNKSGLIRAIRANEMKSRLDYPLAANQMQLSSLGLEAGTGAQNRSAMLAGLGMETGAALQSRGYDINERGMQLGTNLAMQGILQNAQQFQAELRNRAFQNRLALTGQAAGLGLGLAGHGGSMPGVPHGSTTISPNPVNWGGIGTAMLGASAVAPYIFGSFAGGAAGAGAAGAAGGAALATSDDRVKDDYGVVARTKGGLPLHLFHYKGERKDAPLRLGVMAQEAERLFPDAVVEDDRGIKLVDYKKVA